MEDRVTPAVDLSAVTAPNILVGKHTLIPLSATDTAGLPLKYTVTSTNSAIQGGIITKGRTLVMEVAGGSGTNAFTGTMLFHLFEDQSPKTTARIIELVNSGFYNGLTFHRVVKGFVAQGGDPTGTGTGGSGTDFDDEYNVGLTFNSFGLLAMANAGDDDNDSQFFITETAAGTSFPEHLNFNHNIFGQLVEGADVLQRIMNTPVDGNSKPTTAVIIKNAYLINDNQHAVLDLSTTLNAAGSGQITVKVTNSRGEVDSQTLTVNVVTGKVNEVVTLTEGTNITAGTYTLSFGGQTTANIAWDATAAQVQAALEALSTIGAGNIAVAGGPLTTAPLTLTFRNQLGSRDVGPVTSNQTNLTGTFTIAVTTPGSSDNPFLGTLFDRQTPTNTPITFDVSATDLDNTQLTFVVRRQDFSPLTDADNVTVTVTSTGLKTARITITPADGFTGLANLLIGVVDETENIDTQPQDKFDTQHFNLLVTDDPISPRNLSLVAGAHVKPGNVVTLDTPTIQFLAPANKTVNVFVNGTQVGTATQFSQSDGEGTYRFTLPNNALVLGSNTITAVTAENGVNSLASTPFTLTFTPSLQQVYVVPGAAGTQTSLTFDFLASHTSSRNEVGVYVVDDMTGSVNGVSPSSAGYRQAVLSSPTRQVLFSKQPGGSTSAKTLSFAAGTKLAFYFVQNKSAANATSATRIYFSFKDANPDKIFHDETFTDHAGRGVYGWEESFKGGDRDFNDMVFAVRHVLANPAVGAVAVDIANPGTTVKTSFSLLPTLASRFRPIGGEIGIFPVLDALGTVRAPLPNNPNRTLKPGDDGYAQAALGQQGVQVIFTRGDVPSASKTRDIEMAGGSLFGVYYLPRGTAASFLDSNPGNSIAAGRINVFFSFASANPDGGKQHMRTFPKEQESRLGSTLLPALNDPQRIHLMGRINGGNANFSDYILTYQQSIAS